MALTDNEKAVVMGYSLNAAAKIAKRFSLERKVPWIAMVISDTITVMLDAGAEEAEAENR